MFVVKELTAGPRFEVIKGDFTRSSQARAWLFDYLNDRKAKAIYSEPDGENPGCFDIMADMGGYARQFAVEQKGR